MKWWKRIFFILSALLVGIQFVRPRLTNPPTDESLTLFADPNVPADVRGILQRSCADCHSNKTVWPWYSHVAPSSWLLADDVSDGRRELNMSQWATFKPKRKARKLDELCDQVKEKEMPQWYYVLMHPAAKLSDADRARLCQWSEAMGRTIVIPKAGT